MASTIDMILLGILLKTPMNAYEIAHFIDEREISRLLKISKPAVYKSCKRLYKSEYLNGKTIRDGEFPEKIIYSVNKKGRERFYSLMEYFSGRVTPFYLDFNSFLWNIEHLNKSQGLAMLQNLRKQLVAVKSWIIEHEKEIRPKTAFAARMIVKQYRMVVITLVLWIDETIAEYTK